MAPKRYPNTYEGRMAMLNDSRAELGRRLLSMLAMPQVPTLGEALGPQSVEQIRAALAADATDLATVREAVGAAIAADHPHRLGPRRLQELLVALAAVDEYVPGKVIGFDVEEGKTRYALALQMLNEVAGAAADACVPAR